MVKCFDCGFLCKRAVRAVTPQPFHELSYVERRAGRASGNYQEPISNPIGGASYRPIQFEFVCLRERRDFVGEFKSRRTTETPVQDTYQEILNEEHTCPEWYPYTEGMEPSKHLEEFKMQQLEQDRRAFEERLDNSNKAFLTGLERERREWEKNAGKWPKRLVVAALILAAAEVVGGVPAIQRLLCLD